jgi:hypothetical protein
MLASARQACAHSSLISLEKLHHFHFKAEEKARKEKKRAEEEAREKGGKTSKKDTISSARNQTREGLLRFALNQAPESARLRMRLAINKYQTATTFWSALYVSRWSAKKILQFLPVPICSVPLVRSQLWTKPAPLEK